MKKEVKDTIIAQLGETLAAYPHFYLVDVTGLNADVTSKLRRKCFKSDVKMVVVKNNLLMKAFEAADIDYSPMYESLKGNTAVMFTNTANVPAKVLKEYKNENPSFKAAYAEENFYIGAEQLNTLAALKSKNELIADIIAALESPIMNVLSALENREEAAVAE